MPRDGSGVYTLPAGNPVVTNTVIASAWANGTMSDIAAQLNNVLTRDGLLGPTGPFKLQDGTVNAPGLAFASEVGLGMYRPSASAMYWAAQGARVMNWEAGVASQTGLGLNPRTAVNGSSLLALINAPSTAANFGQFVISMSADGLGRLVTSKTGTGVAAGIGLSPADGNVYVNGTPTVALSMGATFGGHAQLNLNKFGAATQNNINGLNNSVNRWVMQLGNEQNETGSNAGSNFVLNSYSDTGAYLGTPINITRFNSNIQFNGPTTVAGQLSISTPAVPALVVASSAAFATMQFNANGALKYIRLNNANGSLEVVNHANTAVIGTISDIGSMSMRYGYGCQPGINTTPGPNVFNINYVAGTGTQLWVDASLQGVFQMASDERIKRGIATLQADTDAYMDIRPIEFCYTEAPEGSESNWGFSAQNLVEVMPKAVYGDINAVDDEGKPKAALVLDRPILAATVVQVQDLIRRITQLENA